MNDYGYSEEHRPLTWWHGHAIYAAHFIVLVWVAAMLVTTALMQFGANTLLGWLPFASDRVLAGELWRIFTYGFVNPPSLWFVIEMAMIVWFGRELERFFGWRIFLRFYIGLYFFLPFVFVLLGLWRPMYLAGESGAFALFIAFATLHPNVPVFFGVLAKWVAAILVGIYTLMALSRNDLAQLFSLWTAAGFAWAFVRHEQGLLAWPDFRLPTRKPSLRVLPGGAKPTVAQRPREAAAMAEIDALLDKIAHSGLSSLTPQERARLDQGRDAIRRKGSGR